jgi:hypothetical protein
MRDAPELFEPLDELESLVQMAGNYVRASDDLRPRVLETARVERRQRTMQKHFWQAAFVLALLGMFTTSLRDRVEAVSSQAFGSAGDWLSSPDTVASTSGSTWEMVESFTAVRRRQAEILRPAL